MARGNSYEELAKDAAARIEQARAAGQQLTFLPDEAAPSDTARAKRGKGKAQTQLRDWLAARGYRMPEDVLAEMAGLASSDDALTTAMAKTEQILAWAQAGASTEVQWINDKGEVKTRPLRAEPTLAERLETLKFVFTAQLRSAESVLPYIHPKHTPDQVVQAVQIVQMPAPSAPRGGDLARDITPNQRRFGPPPMPHEMQQNQDLSKSPLPPSDASDRTE